MKFKEAYKLICEDRFDDLSTKYPKLTPEIYWIKKVYNYLPQDLKVHNKFSKFFEWVIVNSTFTIKKMTEYPTLILFEKTFKGYLKYNIKLENYTTVEELQDYINDKERLENLIIDESLAKKIYEDEEKIVIMPLNYKGSEKYGSSTWCIQRDESAWKNYLADGKLSHFVLYKSPAKIEIPEFGTEKNWNITNIQVDLDGKFYITNTENTVGLGVTDTKADKILQFMKLDKKIFKSLNDKETLKLIADNNKDILNYISDDNRLYNLLLDASLIEVTIQKKWANAIKNNNIEEVRQIIANKDFDINCSINNDENWTGLFYAIDTGKIEIVKEILKSEKVNINIYGRNRIFPLLYACVKNFNEIVTLLMNDSRIDLNQVDDGGTTSFIYTCREDKRSLAKLFISNMDVNINAQTNYGHTPLIYLSANNYAEIFDAILTRKDLDINIQNKIGNTALHYACENNYKYIIRQLIKLPNIKLDIKNNHGKIAYDLLSRDNKIFFDNEVAKLRGLPQKDSYSINFGDYSINSEYYNKNFY